MLDTLLAATAPTPHFTISSAQEAEAACAERGETQKPDRIAAAMRFGEGAGDPIEMLTIHGRLL
jgi:hypothetical protein